MVSAVAVVSANVVAPRPSTLVDVLGLRASKANNPTASADTPTIAVNVGSGVSSAAPVLGAAVAHGHDAIVLGAWGCGVFKNEPRDVARAFSSLLAGKYRGRFARVVFAILGGGEANLAAFRETFGGAPAAAAAAPTLEAPTPRPGAYFLVMDFEAT